MYFKEKLVACLSVALFFTAQVNAQDTTAVKAGVKEVKSMVRPYSAVITAKAVSKHGMFTVHKIDDKYFFEIPDSLLKREILLTSRILKAPAGSPISIGELINEKTLCFEKGNNNNIFLKVVTLVATADSTNVISKAVRNANTDPIAMVFDAKAYGNHSTVIDVTSLIKTDNMFYCFDAKSKKNIKVGGMAAERSWIESVNTYPINIEAKMIRTYSFGGGGAAPAEGAAPADAKPEVDNSAGVTFELSTSLMLMPKVPMQARLFDPHVGYFAEGYSIFSDDQQKVEDKTFITRYRLEPKAEDIEKYKKGELVEPKKQIVFYTDPATPKQWRPYIITAVNDWQKAFEQAGFKNAIVGKEWPENDTTMNIEDARYAVIRYMPSQVENARGVSIHDPRSGEILQSYVAWYHNIMQVLHTMYFVEAAAVDTGAQKMKFDDKLMGQLIRSAVSHEIGHTLGLRHNMGASSETSVEKLRDKAWVEANGTTVSIMDYARFNYVAQPEDHIGRAGMMPRIGAYDKWAIQWGYKLTGTKDEKADQKIVTKWMLDSLKSDPKLWFGGEGRNNDPRAQAEDLGDNSMKANEYGIKNLKKIVPHLLDWTKGENNNTYDDAEDMYEAINHQYELYGKHALANIAGLKETIKSVEQEGNVYEITPKATQKEAVAFLTKEYLQTPTWLLNADVLNKFRKPVKPEYVNKMQHDIIMHLCTDKLYPLTLQTMRYGAANTYTADEYLTDVEKGVYSELATHKPIDYSRRLLQKEYITWMATVLNKVGAKAESGAMDITNTDIPALLRLHLTDLQSAMRRAIPFYTDEVTKDHLKYTADKIKDLLKGK